MSTETPITGNQLDQLREYDTALLANLLGFVDPIPTHEFYMSNSIRALTPELGPTVGIAVTCEMDSSTPNHLASGDTEGYWTQLAQMEALNVPTVWVVRCVGSRPEHECVLGDGMAKFILIAGNEIDGESNMSGILPRLGVGKLRLFATLADDHGLKQRHDCARVTETSGAVSVWLIHGT